MENAESVVRDILQEILVQGSQQKIKAVDSQTAIRYMNMVMFELDAIGISLGYTEVKTLGDTITIAPGAIRGLITNTAIALLSSYDITPNIQLAESAKTGLNAMRKIARITRRTRTLSTLPIGSGNEGYNDFNHNKFFPAEQSSILNEQNGHILLEDTTNE